MNASLRASAARLFPAALLALGLAGCPNTDPSVFVDAEITDPKATVTPGALGTSLAGSFTLTLHLGARAADSSKVELGAFSIQSADRKTTIVEPLAASSTTTFPVTVDPDSDVSAAFTFDTGKSPLPADVATELCAAGGVVISGVVDDSLKGGSTPFVSDAFHPTGCP